MKNNYDDDFIYSVDSMVDISDINSLKQAPKNKRAKKPKTPTVPDGYTDINNIGKFSVSDKNPKNRKKIIIISSVAATVVVALGIAGFSLLNNGGILSSEDDKDFVFPKNASVSGISLADKTLSQAKTLLEAKKEEFIKPVRISVDTNSDLIELTEADFSYNFDIDEVLARVKSDAEDKSINISEMDYEVTALVTKDSITKKATEIKGKIDRKPKNAFVSEFKPYSDHRFIYTDAENGCSLDSATLENDIGNVFAKNLSESRIIATIEPVSPEITVDNIKKNVVKLATYETVSYNTENGTSNMDLSLKACNGSIINPGEVWSFNECTGDSNLESNGYKPANVISEGQIISGIGGGICQTSSTIYYAAVKSNLEIEERYNHMWASSYVPTGLDATIDYPRLDLKLSNPTQYQMFLECKLVDRTLTATFWGYKSPDYDEIRTYNEITDRSSSNYKVKAWRIYCKDGKEISRESLGTSTYDSDKGYVFYPAENDIEPTKNNNDNNNQSQPTTAKPTEPKPTEKPTQKPTQKPTESKPSEKPTQKPTEAPSSEQPSTEPTEESSEPSEE